MGKGIVVVHRLTETGRRSGLPKNNLSDSGRPVVPSSSEQADLVSRRDVFVQDVRLAGVHGVSSGEHLSALWCP